jgi:hypothetical protein
MANFTKIEEHLEKNPCEDWKFSYDWAFYLTIISGALVGAINGIGMAIFE